VWQKARAEFGDKQMRKSSTMGSQEREKNDCIFNMTKMQRDRCDIGLTKARRMSADWIFQRVVTLHRKAAFSRPPPSQTSNVQPLESFLMAGSMVQSTARAQHEQHPKTSCARCASAVSTQLVSCASAI
jgi:hypothetical protein